MKLDGKFNVVYNSNQWLALVSCRFQDSRYDSRGQILVFCGVPWAVVVESWDIHLTLRLRVLAVGCWVSPWVYRAVSRMGSAHWPVVQVHVGLGLRDGRRDELMAMVKWWWLTGHLASCHLGGTLRHHPVGIGVVGLDRACWGSWVDHLGEGFHRVNSIYWCWTGIACGGPWVASGGPWVACGGPWVACGGPWVASGGPWVASGGPWEVEVHRDRVGGPRLGAGSWFCVCWAGGRETTCCWTTSVLRLSLHLGTSVLEPHLK